MRDKSVAKIPLGRFKEGESGSSRREWPWDESKFQDPQSNCLLPDQLLILTNRMQVTDVGVIFPDPKVVPCGVPHGSILRPFFF